MAPWGGRGRRLRRDEFCIGYVGVEMAVRYTGGDIQKEIFKKAWTRDLDMWVLGTEQLSEHRWNH